MCGGRVEGWLVRFTEVRTKMIRMEGVVTFRAVICPHLFGQIEGNQYITEAGTQA